MMHMTKYQRLAERTARRDMDPRVRLAVAALGLAGESGEVADLVKKTLGHGHELDRDKLMLELGDVLWYLAELATILEVDLHDVAHANVDKLVRRYPDGFSSHRSINRDD